jgi:hypothetical protein
VVQHFFILCNHQQLLAMSKIEKGYSRFLDSEPVEPADKPKPEKGA